MLKRGFDIVASGVGLIILSPLLLVFAVAIYLYSPGPIFYRATRVGRYGRTFCLYKFRSMVVDADKRGPGITIANDLRITGMGWFLRRTKIDELPQLFNVLRGDMSLVGPRPEDSQYVALYTPAQREVLNVRPGITSLASLLYRDEEAQLSGEEWERRYIEEIMPAKLAIDLDYARRASLCCDLSIVLRTILWLTTDCVSGAFRVVWRRLRSSVKPDGLRSIT